MSRAVPPEIWLEEWLYSEVLRDNAFLGKRLLGAICYRGHDAGDLRVFRQFRLSSGRIIDLILGCPHHRTVVIELKRRATDHAVSQVLEYIDELCGGTKSDMIRAVIAAFEISDSCTRAAQASDIALIKVSPWLSSTQLTSVSVNRKKPETLGN